MDRNDVVAFRAVCVGQSLSARRAWIEISTEGVGSGVGVAGRSPQGERG